MSSREFAPAPWSADDAVREALFAACESVVPREAVGLVAADSAGRARVVPLANSAGAVPGRERFEADAAALLGELRDLARRGERLVAIYHSHVERPPVWSHEDDRAARGFGGEPLWPGVEQVVVEVRGGRAVAMARYRWDQTAYRRAAVERRA